MNYLTEHFPSLRLVEEAHDDSGVLALWGCGERGTNSYTRGRRRGDAERNHKLMALGCGVGTEG